MAEEGRQHAADDAAVLEAAGLRDAAVLQVAGERDAAGLEAARAGEAAILSTEAHRGINAMWERTQKGLSQWVVSAVLLANSLVVVTPLGILLLYWRDLDPGLLPVLIALIGGALSSLTSLGSLVVGFYFGRTNHERKDK